MDIETTQELSILPEESFLYCHLTCPPSPPSASTYTVYRLPEQGGAREAPSCSTLERALSRASATLLAYSTPAPALSWTSKFWEVYAGEAKPREGAATTASTSASTTTHGVFPPTRLYCRAWFSVKKLIERKTA
jgi:hypothetical protein